MLMTTREKNGPGYCLVIHGGVGTILQENMSAEKEKAYELSLEAALKAGEEILERKGSALQAVEAALRVMEDSPLFNAGKGSVFTHDGTIEMDASIMDGRTGAAGAVAAVSGIKNPISLALKVLQHSDHVMLMGKGAEQFARMHGCVFETEAYFHTDARYEQLQMAQQQDKVVLDHSGANTVMAGNVENGGRKLGTIGAVARDAAGNLAAATSTGGMTNKRFGRIGDTPLIGAGTYASNQNCAVSCTGHGEYFIKNVVAYDVAALMAYKGWSLQKAADYVINKKLKAQQAEGGLIAIDRWGNYIFTFNTEGMYRGVVEQGKAIETRIYQ